MFNISSQSMPVQTKTSDWPHKFQSEIESYLQQCRTKKFLVIGLWVSIMSRLCGYTFNKKVASHRFTFIFFWQMQNIETSTSNENVLLNSKQKSWTSTKIKHLFWCPSTLKATYGLCMLSMWLGISVALFSCGKTRQGLCSYWRVWQFKIFSIQNQGQHCALLS